MFYRSFVCSFYKILIQNFSRYLPSVYFFLQLTLVRNELNGLVFKVSPPSSSMQATTNLQYIVSLDSTYIALRLTTKPPAGPGQGMNLISRHSYYTTHTKISGRFLKNHLPLFQDLNFNPPYRLNLSRWQFGLTKVAPLFRQLFLPYGCNLCVKCNTFLFQKLRGKTTWTLSTDFLKQRFVYLKFVTLPLK